MSFHVKLPRCSSPIFNEAISNLFNSLQDYPKLSNEEMISLFKEMKKGGAEAAEIRERLICCNVRLAYYVACYFASESLKSTFEDIVSASIIGIISAVDTFDPDKGCTFSTYATPRCYEEVSMYLNSYCNMIYIPIKKHTLLKKVIRYIDELHNNGQEAPAIAELAELFNISQDELSSLLSTRNVVSLEFSPNPDDEDWTFIDQIPDFSTPSPEDTCLERHLLDYPNLKITKHQALITMQVLGLPPFSSPCSFAELAQKYGCSRQSVEQAYKRTIKKIRKVINT